MTPQPLTLDGLLALCEKATLNVVTDQKSYIEWCNFLDECSPEVVAALVRCVQASIKMRELSVPPSEEHWLDVRIYDHARAALDAAMRGKG